MSALNEIRKFFQGLQTLYQTYIPKVDPILINDLLSRQEKNADPDSAPFYMVEMFTKDRTDEEAKREFIIRKTGMAPAIYDKGTHYVTNQRLTLELLDELAEPEDVLEITGDYTGNLSGVGASHDYSGNPSGVGSLHSRSRFERSYPSKKNVDSKLENSAEESQQLDVDKLHEIRLAFNGLQTLYDSYLSKIDPDLINDLLSRQQKDPDSAPFYMVEIFTEDGTDEDAKREFIIRKTGMAPAIYDKGTHYVTNQRLTLELLNELAEPEDVIKITGDFTGNLSGVGASHSRREALGEDK
ncbi:MAG TPA: hypothetical protein VFC05_00190 [Nitrososphaeraceae archaeon]|nr:hypothetical protein [Nitrososphaeraceae archaeon]